VARKVSASKAIKAVKTVKALKAKPRLRMRLVP
jgi:hypothetical protein